MIEEDIEQYRLFWRDFLKKNDKYINTVAIHSPYIGKKERAEINTEARVFNEIFKNKKIYLLSKKNWDLNDKIPVKFDLLIVNNVFMYSNNPELWFGNVFNSCKFLIVQDLINRKRGGEDNDYTNQFHKTVDDGDEDEDSMRYSFSHLDQNSLSKIQYDLSKKFANRIINVEFYKTNNVNGKNFICAFRGDWPLLNNDKIVRIDDFPTGIRPILDDLEPIYNVLMEFEKRNIRFVLGIVPSLLTNEMIERLKTFKYLILAQHGFNHKYDELSKKLIKNKDPYNDWCCMDQFNEFEGMSKEDIREKLEEGKKILEQIGPMDIYIPPCNKLDPNTLSVLEDMNIKFILGDNIHLQSEKKKIQILPSGFYGRVKDLNSSNAKSQILTFHATWEFDDLFRKNYDKKLWDQRLDLLNHNQTDSKQEERPQIKLERLGTKYGGWHVPCDMGLDENSIVYSGGVGEDVSFDLLLSEKYKCNILLIDPTEKSKIHFEEIKKYYEINKWRFTGDIQKDYYGILYPIKPEFDKIKYLDVGLWDKKTTLEFYKQSNPDHCSQTFIHDMFGEEYDEVQVDTIKNIMERFGHKHIDLLKLDIEGSEVKVLNNMLDDGIHPRFLCIEFDLLIKGKDTYGKTQKLANRLGSLGYQILVNDNLNITFKYMK